MNILKRSVHVLKKNLTNNQKGIKDPEYSALHKQFHAKELSIYKFLTHMKQFSETLNALSTNMRNIAQDSQELFGDDNPEISSRFFEVAEHFEKQCIRPGNERIENSILLPLENFCQEFKLMKEFHQERKSSVLDFEMAREKLDSLVNKSQAANKQTEMASPLSTIKAASSSISSPSSSSSSAGPIISKRDTIDIPKAKELLEKTKKEYEVINSAGKKKLVEIHEKSLNIFDQTFAAFAGQVKNFPDIMKEACTKPLQSVPKSQNVSTTKITLSTKTPVNISQTSSYNSLKDDIISDTTNYGDESSPKKAQNAKSLPKPNNPIPEELQTEWYYLDDNVQQKGPHTLVDLKNLFANGKIGPETHVFGGDLKDWQALAEYLSLLKYLKS